MDSYHIREFKFMGGLHPAISTTIVTQPRVGSNEDKTQQSLVEEQLNSLKLLTVEWIDEETDDSYNDRKSRKHFSITNKRGKQVLSATTENVFCTRIGFGRIQHPLFDVKLLYPTDTNYDAFHLFRSLCWDSCCCPCSLQMLDIYNSTKRQFVGSVRQKYNLLYAVFHLCDANNKEMAIIRGNNLKMDTYKVFTMSEDEIGSICYKSSVKIDDGLQCRESWAITYTEGIHVDLKIMMLCAAFLIDCIFNEAPTFLRNN